MYIYIHAKHVNQIYVYPSRRQKTCNFSWTCKLQAGFLRNRPCSHDTLVLKKNKQLRQAKPLTASRCRQGGHRQPLGSQPHQLRKWPARPSSLDELQRKFPELRLPHWCSRLRRWDRSRLFWMLGYSSPWRWEAPWLFCPHLTLQWVQLTLLQWVLGLSAPHLTLQWVLGLWAPRLQSRRHPASCADLLSLVFWSLVGILRPWLILYGIASGLWLEPTCNWYIGRWCEIHPNISISSMFNSSIHATAEYITFTLHNAPITGPGAHSSQDEITTDKRSGFFSEGQSLAEVWMSWSLQRYISKIVLQIANFKFKIFGGRPWPSCQEEFSKSNFLGCN